MSNINISSVASSKSDLWSIALLLLSISISLIASGFFTSYLGLMIVNVGTSAFWVGLIQSCVYLGLFTGGLISGKAISLLGLKNSVRLFWCGIALSTSAFAVYTNLGYWFVCRFFMGVALAGVYSCVESWLHMVAEDRWRGRLFAIYLIANFSSLALGQYLLPTVLHSTISGFVIAAIFYFSAVLPVSFAKAPTRTGALARISQAFPSRAGQESVKHESAQFLSGDGVLKHIEVDKNEQTRSLPAIGSRSRNKLEKCGLDVTSKLHALKRISLRQALGTVLREKPLAFFCCLANGLVSSSYYGLSATSGQSLGLTGYALSQFCSVPIIIAMFAQFPLGYLSDLFGRRWVLVIISCVALAFSLAPFMSSETSPLLLFIGQFGVGMAMGSYGLSSAHANDSLPENYVVPVSVGLITAHAASGIIGPLLASLTINFLGGLGIFAFCSISYGLAFLSLFDKRDKTNDMNRKA